MDEILIVWVGRDVVFGLAGRQSGRVERRSDWKCVSLMMQRSLSSWRLVSLQFNNIDMLKY